MMENAVTFEIINPNSNVEIEPEPLAMAGDVESVKPLNELKEGDVGRIVSVNMISLDCLREIAAIGILPFATIRVAANHAHHIIAHINDKKFAADKETASHILVQMV